MITIKEIADKAGVTATTVSNVIHGKTSKVSPAKVEEIQALLDQYQYIPRFGLNALTSKKSKLVGVLISTPEFLQESAYDKPFYGKIIGGLEKELREQGYYIMVFSSKNIDDIIRMALGWNVDGIIAVTVTRKNCEKIEKAINKPVVCIDMDVDDLEDAQGCYNVTSTDWETGVKAVEYFKEHGIEKLFYLLNVRRGADYRRYSGANQRYRELYGASNDLPMIVLGEEAMRMQQYNNLMRYRNQKTGLFFSTDLNAAEALSYFVRNGVVVPREFSIIGVDDEVYARFVVPNLTTFHVPLDEKVKIAVVMLLKLLNGKVVKEPEKVVVARLVERESVYQY